MTVCVVAECCDGSISKLTYSAVNAACRLTSDPVEVVVPVQVEQQELNELCQTEQVGKVWYCPATEAWTAEAMVALLQKTVVGYSHLLAASSTFTKDWLPRLAGVLGCYAMTDVVEIVSSNQYVRPIYAGNALEHVELNQDLTLVSIRATVFDQQAQGETVAEICQLEVPIVDAKWARLTAVAQPSGELDLTTAPVVVSGGRGVGSADGFTQIKQLAHVLGAAVGASRAAVDAEYVPNEYQVGQTGKIIAPELYIAIGISGAIQHIAGMKDSKVIIAINSDEDAPIFKVSDFGLVADLHQAVPTLIELIKS
ncbi:MAG: electron transfer flavoprotein subunit alpha [Legionellales bacterium]|nr:electron transfer flavoprotein subunit alpha [Legionellales bacterium]|tara:strand:+ start:1588 stop:2520 length:933 start_codon:yes stop_codon:yes gene_type:complete